MSKSKSSGKNRTPATRPNSNTVRQNPSAPPTVSGRWLITALAIVIAGALLCAWGTLCLLFWQGSWQLLYHPASAVARTPASDNLPFDSVGFAANTSGEPQLQGWWIPAASPAHYTAICLHGASGNLGDSVDALARLHALGLNVFAFDYRGYGQSHFVHPSEAHWREDADSAIRYLTGTRHLAQGSLILVGKDLGANLALETAAAHPDLAGIILENPLESPTTAIFVDGRSHLVPARLLVSDRWETNTAASNLLIPSLWFYWTVGHSSGTEEDTPEAYLKTPARKSLVWLTNSPDEPKQFTTALTGWLDQLQSTH
jgi:pimeloyl-ACP methyl ester carboxylesterase